MTTQSLLLTSLLPDADEDRGTMIWLFYAHHRKHLDEEKIRLESKEISSMVIDQHPLLGERDVNWLIDSRRRRRRIYSSNSLRQDQTMHHFSSCSWGETSFLDKSVNSRRLSPMYGDMCDIANAIRIRTRHSIVWQWCIFLDQLPINLHFVGTRYETRGWERIMTVHLRASKHLYFRQLDKQFYELDWIDHFFLSIARSTIKCTTLSERLLFLSPRPTTLPLIRHPSNSWCHHSPHCPVDWRCSVH